MMIQESGLRLAGLMVEEAAERRRVREREEKRRRERIVAQAAKIGLEVEMREALKMLQEAR